MAKVSDHAVDKLIALASTGTISNQLSADIENYLRSVRARDIAIVIELEEPAEDKTRNGYAPQTVVVALLRGPRVATVCLSRRDNGPITEAWACSKFKRSNAKIVALEEVTHGTV